MKKKKKSEMREMLINKIMEVSGDEFETVEHMLEMAKESEEQLVNRIINLLDWFYDEYNSK